MPPRESSHRTAQKRGLTTRTPGPVAARGTTSRPSGRRGVPPGPAPRVVRRSISPIPAIFPAAPPARGWQSPCSRRGRGSRGHAAPSVADQGLPAQPDATTGVHRDASEFRSGRARVRHPPRDAPGPRSRSSSALPCSRRSDRPRWSSAHAQEAPAAVPATAPTGEAPRPASRSRRRRRQTAPKPRSAFTRVRQGRRRRLQALLLEGDRRLVRGRPRCRRPRAPRRRGHRRSALRPGAGTADDARRRRQVRQPHRGRSRWPSAGG